MTCTRLIVVGGIVLGLILGSWPASAQESATPTAIEPALVRLFPPTTEWVITLQLRRALAAELLRDKKAFLPLVDLFLESKLQEQSPEVAKYVRKLGLKYSQDLDSLTVVGAAGSDPAQVLILLSGRFDVAKWQAAAREAAQAHADTFRIRQQEQQTIWEITLPEKQGTLQVALVNDHLLLASPGRDTLTAALGRVSAPTPGKLKKEVRKLLADLDPQAALGMLATGNALAKMVEANPAPQLQAAAPALEKLLAKLQGVSLDVTLTEDLNFQLGIRTASAEARKALVQQANFGLLILQSTLAKYAKEDARFQPALEVLKTVRVSVQDDRFQLRGRIPRPVLEQLLQEALQRYLQNKGK
jgi:hypothetical protein